MESGNHVADTVLQVNAHFVVNSAI